MRRGFALLLLLLGPTLTGPLRAEPALRAASDAERADQLFRKGTEAFEKERYSDAYGALRAAWDLAPSYRTAAGLGQVELHLTQYRDAAEHLAYCLRSFPTSGDGGARRHVEEGLAQAREHVAALRVRVDPEGAEVAVDGHPAGRAPLDGLLFVDPGPHIIQASAEGRTTTSETVDAPVRVTRDVSLSLVASPSASSSASSSGLPASAKSAPAAESTRPSGGSTVSSTGLSDTVWTVIIGGSLTAVAVGTAVLFDVKGASANHDVDDLRRGIGSGGDCAAPSSTQAPLCANLRASADERNRDDQIALIAGIAAGVLGAATVGTAIFLESRRGAPERAAHGMLSMRIKGVPGGAAVMLRGVL
jgi:hypothetical protein